MDSRVGAEIHGNGAPCAESTKSTTKGVSVMSRRVLVILFELGLLGTTLPAFEKEGGQQRVQMTTTKHLSFPPGGSIHVNDSYGDLNIEGWEQPEIEIVAIRSMPYDYKRKRPDEAARHLDAGARHENGAEGSFLFLCPIPERICYARV
jgi:hypothetical protein